MRTGNDWLRDAIAAKRGRPVDNPEPDKGAEPDEAEGSAR